MISLSFVCKRSAGTSPILFLISRDKLYSCRWTPLCLTQNLTMSTPAVLHLYCKSIQIHYQHYLSSPTGADTINCKTESAAARAVVNIIVVVKWSLTALSMSAYVCKAPFSLQTDAIHAHGLKDKNLPHSHLPLQQLAINV